VTGSARPLDGHVDYQVLCDDAAYRWVLPEQLERIEPGETLTESSWQDLLRRAGEEPDATRLENIRLRAGAKADADRIAELKQAVADWKAEELRVRKERDAARAEATGNLLKCRMQPIETIERLEHAIRYVTKINGELRAQVATLTRERDEALQKVKELEARASARTNQRVADCKQIADLKAEAVRRGCTITELKAERDDAIISRDDAQKSNDVLRSHISKLMRRCAAYRRFVKAVAQANAYTVTLDDQTLPPVVLISKDITDQAEALLKPEAEG
jgi:chromosome segregation ATPase